MIPGRSREYIKCDCMTPGVRAEGMETGGPEGFLLNNAGEGQDLRCGLILWINCCLCSWPEQQDRFGFYDHWTPWLLGRDEVHLTKCGKSIFINRLANVCRYLAEGIKKTTAHTDRMRGNGHKLIYQKFHLNTETSFTLKIRTRLPREVVEHPSLQVFMWNMVLSNLPQLTLTWAERLD